MAGQIQMNRKRPILIAPSILSADPLGIGNSIDRLENEFDWIHVDIMDGHFVPNLSYGPAIVSSLRKRYSEGILDVHLMVEPPEDFIGPFSKAGSSFLTVHVEATRHLDGLLRKIRESGCRPGVSLNPSTPVELVRPVLPLVDLVLVMSVNPGFGGQHLISYTLDKAIRLCQWREAEDLDFLIEMDGGIGLDNLMQVVSSGTDVIVMGNSIFTTPDPAGTIRKMRLMLKEEEFHERQN